MNRVHARTRLFDMAARLPVAAVAKLDQPAGARRAELLGRVPLTLQRR
jgi:hypothetical protein